MPHRNASHSRSGKNYSIFPEAEEIGGGGRISSSAGIWNRVEISATIAIQDDLADDLPWVGFSEIGRSFKEDGAAGRAGDIR